jgi:hypothetical protein
LELCDALSFFTIKTSLYQVKKLMFHDVQTTKNDPC